MKKSEKFKLGITVKVAECYRNDEVTAHRETSPTAVVMSEPDDEEELISIQFDNGDIDFVSQDILEPFTMLDKIVEAIKQEIAKLKSDDAYYSNEESEVNELNVMNLLKEAGYNSEEDEEATQYFLKATQIEIYEYHLSNIIPKLG